MEKPKLPSTNNMHYLSIQKYTVSFNTVIQSLTNGLHNKMNLFKAKPIYLKTTTIFLNVLQIIWTFITHTVITKKLIDWLVITARCTLVQSAVLRSHFACLSVRPSVCLSVTLVDCDHISWNSSKIISMLVSLGCSLFATPTWLVCSKGNTPKFGHKVTHPCWFERRRHSIANCGRMVTGSATVTMESL